MKSRTELFSHLFQNFFDASYITEYGRERISHTAHRIILNWIFSVTKPVLVLNVNNTVEIATGEKTLQQIADSGNAEYVATSSGRTMSILSFLNEQMGFSPVFEYSLTLNEGRIVREEQLRAIINDLFLGIPNFISICDNLITSLNEPGFFLSDKMDQHLAILKTDLIHSFLKNISGIVSVKISEEGQIEPHTKIPVPNQLIVMNVESCIGDEKLVTNKNPNHFLIASYVLPQMNSQNQRNYSHPLIGQTTNNVIYAMNGILTIETKLKAYISELIEDCVRIAITSKSLNTPNTGIFCIKSDTINVQPSFGNNNHFKL